MSEAENQNPNSDVREEGMETKGFHQVGSSPTGGAKEISPAFSLFLNAIFSPSLSA